MMNKQSLCSEFLRPAHRQKEPSENQLQKHFLEDGNAPQSEIDKIVAPKIELNFLADGVLIPTSSSKQK